MKQLQERVEHWMQDHVIPRLAMHGGYIEQVDIAHGKMQVTLGGECSGCPCADLTVRALIKEEVQKVFPEIKEVQLVNGVSDDLIKTAHSLLRQRS